RAQSAGAAGGLSGAGPGHRPAPGDRARQRRRRARAVRAGVAADAGAGIAGADHVREQGRGGAAGLGEARAAAAGAGRAGAPAGRSGESASAGFPDEKEVAPVAGPGFLSDAAAMAQAIQGFQECAVNAKKTMNDLENELTSTLSQYQGNQAIAFWNLHTELQE